MTDIDRDNDQFNEGVTHTVELLAKTIGATGWVAGDGSEDYDEDLAQTLLNIVAAKGLYDPDTGRYAALAPPEPTEGQIEAAAEAIWNEESIRITGKPRSVAWGEVLSMHQDRYRQLARAALNALSLQDHGWKELTRLQDRTKLDGFIWKDLEGNVFATVDARWRIDLPALPMVAEERASTEEERLAGTACCYIGVKPTFRCPDCPHDALPSQNRGGG